MSGLTPKRDSAVLPQKGQVNTHASRWARSLGEPVSGGTRHHKSFLRPTCFVPRYTYICIYVLFFYFFQHPMSNVLFFFHVCVLCFALSCFVFSRRSRSAAAAAGACRKRAAGASRRDGRRAPPRRLTGAAATSKTPPSRGRAGSSRATDEVTPQVITLSYVGTH